MRHSHWGAEYNSTNTRACQHSKNSRPNCDTPWANQKSHCRCLRHHCLTNLCWFSSKSLHRPANQGERSIRSNGTMTGRANQKGTILFHHQLHTSCRVGRIEPRANPLYRRLHQGQNFRNHWCPRHTRM